MFKGYGEYDRYEHLEKIRKIMRAEIKHLIFVFAEHFRDNWFPSVGDDLDWDVPMPYDGKLLFKRVSQEPARFVLFLHNNSRGNCNFPQHEVIKLAAAIEKEISAQVTPDFSNLPNGYTGELSDIEAIRHRSDYYGPNI